MTSEKSRLSTKKRIEDSKGTIHTGEKMVLWEILE
jgi:hypothetical protein